MRNPLNSWGKSDSGCGYCKKYLHIVEKHIECDAQCPCWSESGFCTCNERKVGFDKFFIGEKDWDLMMRLRNAGTDHRKFMRMIVVYTDITAPLYWWKEFDTYKVGTTANSCSTMHKIADKEFSLDDFSCEHLLNESVVEWGEIVPSLVLESIVLTLNAYRKKYLETKDKRFWWQLIQLLPSSYNQKRTVTMNYEVLANIYKSRKDHKLDEWRIGFIDWIENLPYSKIITEKEN